MYGFGWNEDKPAPKYKAGDRVKVIKNVLGRTFPVGEFGTIKEVLGHGVTVSRDGHDDYGWFFGPDEIEPAPTQVVQGRYRVGDRAPVVKVWTAWLPRLIIWRHSRLARFKLSLLLAVCRYQLVTRMVLSN